MKSEDQNTEPTGATSTPAPAEVKKNRKKAVLATGTKKSAKKVAKAPKKAKAAKPAKVAKAKAPKKDKAPKVAKSANQASNRINVGMLTDEQFKEKFPEAFKLFEYFDSCMNKAGLIHTTKFRKKSRLVAWDVVTNHKQVDVEKFRKCIGWAFSNDRKSMPFWGSVPVNHLETVLSMYATYLVKTGNKAVEIDGLNNYVPQSTKEV